MAPTTFYFGLPVLLVMIAFEIRHSVKEHKHAYERKDSLLNIAIGIGYFFINFAAKLMIFAIYEFIYQFRLFNPGDAWWVWVLAFFAHDLTFYISHRATHEIGCFWASHAVHHSSEQFNLLTALRMPWTDNFTGLFLFWLWLPLLGFHPFLIMLVGQVCLVYGALVHTESIDKLHPLVEFIFNTPSHHRVHHSSNPKYLDKNHGEVLIIWDRLFGTFQEEEERATYGLTTRDQFNNALDIEFSEWKKLLRKIRNASSLKEAFNYIIQPPGWSPDGSSKTVKQLRMENTITKSTAMESINRDQSIDYPKRHNPFFVSEYEAERCQYMLYSFVLL